MVRGVPLSEREMRIATRSWHLLPKAAGRKARERTPLSLSGRMPIHPFVGPVLLALVACTPPPVGSEPEDFATAFQKMQSEPAFLDSRVHSDLQVIEEFSTDGDTVDHRRVIPCSLEEIQEAGWRVLPPADLLAPSGIKYSAPAFDGPDQVSVVLGPEESAADARYSFRRSAGAWKLTQIVVYAHLEPGADLPPLPCREP